jgi:hypothetical protein
MTGRGRSQKNIDLIEHSKRILAEIKPSTSRGVAYQLFTRGLIENMGSKCVENVARQIVLAREEGLIPWRWIVDETRWEERSNSWDCLGDFGESVTSQYRKDFWQHQSAWLKVFSEKSTIGGVIRPVLSRFAVPFQIMHGYGSATSLHNVAEVSNSDDKRLLEILYIGDFDPSGMHMSEVDLPARIKKYNGAVKITRIALTRDDCTSLPPFDAKTKKGDTRYEWFTKNYGTQCWELDAMSPNVLRQRVEDEIVDRIDPEAWNHCQQVEEAERESLNRYVQAWGWGHE